MGTESSSAARGAVCNSVPGRQPCLGHQVPFSAATPIWGAIATTKGLGGATGNGGRWGTGGDEERAALSPEPPHPFLPAAARCSAPSSAPSHHCGSADGSSVTSLFLPPCFDPAVLIVQANPTLRALAASQSCY